ncbi:MAG: hypothetical protein K1X83_11780 [Oligoflexia bacterium]|nr:hypothetical protein [Oligoflexia bacterium]
MPGPDEAIPPVSAIRFMPEPGPVVPPPTPVHSPEFTENFFDGAFRSGAGEVTPGATPGEGAIPVAATAEPLDADAEIDALFVTRDLRGAGGGDGGGVGTGRTAGRSPDPDPARRPKTELAPKQAGDATSLARVGEPISQNPFAINAVTVLGSVLGGAMLGGLASTITSNFYPYFAPAVGFYASLFAVSFFTRHGYLQHFKRVGNRIQTPIEKMKQAWDNPDVIHDYMREVRNFTAGALGNNLLGFQRRSSNKLVAELVDKGLMGLDPEDTKEFANLLKGRTLRQLMQVLDYIMSDRSGKEAPSFLKGHLGALRDKEIERQHQARSTFARAIGIETLFLDFLKTGEENGAIKPEQAQEYREAIESLASKSDPSSIYQRIVNSHRLEQGLQSRGALDTARLTEITAQTERDLLRKEFRTLAERQDPALMRAIGGDQELLKRAKEDRLTDDDLTGLRSRFTEQLKQLPPKLVEMQREGNFRRLLDAMILDFDNPLLQRLDPTTGELRMDIRSQLKALVAPFRYNRMSSIIFRPWERGDQNYSLAAPFESMCVATKDLFNKVTLWRDTPSAFSQAQIRGLVINELAGFWLGDAKLDNGMVRGSIQRQLTWRSNWLLGTISQGVSNWIAPRDGNGHLKLAQAVAQGALTVGAPLLFNLGRIWFFG